VSREILQESRITRVIRKQLIRRRCVLEGLVGRSWLGWGGGLWLVGYADCFVFTASFFHPGAQPPESNTNPNLHSHSQRLSPPPEPPT